MGRSTPRGVYADSMPVATGGRMIQRTPNDPAWYRGGLYHDDMPWTKPSLWFMSWYDVSVGSKQALFEHARAKGTTQAVRDARYAVIAPVAHCACTRATENTVVGERPMGDARDTFTYDPMHPVPSYGGNVSCTGNAIQAGALDQRRMEERPDILVYTSEPLREGLEVTGPVTVTLHVSSDAKDTDFTVKLLDVDTAGRARHLDETIQRMRWRAGYDRAPVWMAKDQVVRVTLGPLDTSNWFAPGHRLRIEVSSSNFPRFDRNLNTGGDNVSETAGVVAHNAVHHGGAHPSSITLSVVPRPAGRR
jgi:putative CocE/NonD family hydrolase